MCPFSSGALQIFLKHPESATGLVALDRFLGTCASERVVVVSLRDGDFENADKQKGEKSRLKSFSSPHPVSQTMSAEITVSVVCS